MDSEAGKKKRVRSYQEKTQQGRRKYIENRVIHGMNKKKAALTAGFSPAMARNARRRIETPEVLDTMQSVGKALLIAAPPEVLAQTFVEGLGATTVKTAQKNGKITDIKKFPDYGTRVKCGERILLIIELCLSEATREHGGEGAGPIQVKGLNYEQINERKQQLIRELRHELGIGHSGEHGGTQTPAEGGEAAGGV